MKEIDITQWTKTGEGGNGVAYINAAEPDVLLKLSRLEFAKADALVREFELSKAVYELGISTPRMYELVSVNGRAAIKCEAVPGKKSLARLCADSPEKIDFYAGRMAELGKSFHATQVQGGAPMGAAARGAGVAAAGLASGAALATGAGVAAAGVAAIPSRKAIVAEAVSLSRLIGRRAKKKLLTFIDGLPDAPTLLHGDFTFSNLILAGDRHYWIDLGNASHGDPYFDLGHFYLFCNIFGRQKRVQDIAHLSDRQMAQFWNSFALAYNGPDNLDEFNRECRRFAALDIIFLGHTQPLTFIDRLFLAILAKKMI